MRLLILTQAVDRDDPVLGFFHRWLEELSSHYESLEVVCLYEGVHALPQNVHVYSLGKERGRSRMAYVWNFFWYVFSLRYDAVLVHMNEEYVVLGGWWWRLSGNTIVLWRNHKMGSWRTRLAVALSHRVCHTSPEAYVAKSPKALVMPVGIDTTTFAPVGAPTEQVLFFGRLDPVKRVDLFIEAVGAAGVEAHLYGSPTTGNEAYAARMAARAAAYPRITLYPAVPHAQAPHVFRAHRVYVNLTPSGSFDKTIGEAMASGCVVVCANEALRGVVPDTFLVKEGEVAEVSSTIASALALPPQERAALVHTQRDWVMRTHGLALLVERLTSLYR